MAGESGPVWVRRDRRGGLCFRSGSQDSSTSLVYKKRINTHAYIYVYGGEDLH